MIHNTLPDAAQGAADLNGLRPHAAGPKFSQGIVGNRQKKKNSPEIVRYRAGVAGSLVCWLVGLVGCVGVREVRRVLEGSWGLLGRPLVVLGGSYGLLSSLGLFFVGLGWPLGALGAHLGRSSVVWGGS